MHRNSIICKLLYMFRVVSPPIIRSTNNCIYNICYWSIVVATCRYRGGVETDLRVLHAAHANQSQLSHRQVATTVDPYQMLFVHLMVDGETTRNM